MRLVFADVDDAENSRKVADAVHSATLVGLSAGPAYVWPYSARSARKNQ